MLPHLRLYCRSSAIGTLMGIQQKVASISQDASGIGNAYRKIKMQMTE